MLWVRDVWWSDPERHICACIFSLLSIVYDVALVWLPVPFVPSYIVSTITFVHPYVHCIATTCVYRKIECIHFVVSTQSNTSSWAMPRATRRPPVIATHSMLCTCVMDMTTSSYFLMKAFLRELLICRTLHIFDIISQLSRLLPIADLKSPVAVLSCCRGQQGQIESTCVRSVEYSVTCQTVTTHPQEGQSKLEPR